MKPFQKIPKKKPFAKKSFGQNFLVDENYINKIISALNPQAGETIIEIGAGRGALTRKLIDSGAKIIAVELERDMIAVLKDEFGESENFTLIESDALKINFGELVNSEAHAPKAKLVANLPYYISTAILQKLIEEREVFAEMILMFQKEVVERITARVGDSERGFLTVLVENYLMVESLFDVPPRAFRPSPKVNSAVVKLIPRTEIVVKNESFFKELISSAFIQKRKTIANNLKLKFPNHDVKKILAACQIEASRRSETLDLSEWLLLSNKIAQAEIDY